MKKYYTRACNFYYGSHANLLIKKKLALPLCGSRNIAFDKVEIFNREKNSVSSRTIGIKAIKKLSNSIKQKVQKDLRKIIQRRKNFLLNVKVQFLLSLLANNEHRLNNSF